jgi:hypothetical protein
LVSPAAGYPISVEAIREWFRRTYGREATEREVGEVQDRVARRDATPPINERLPGEGRDASPEDIPEGRAIEPPGDE